MSPCTFWSGLILATSSIAVLHLGQPITSFCLVSDTTNLNSSSPKLKLVNARTFPLYRPKVLTRFFAAMPISSHLGGQHFDPETIRLMGIAFEMAPVSLQRTDG